MSRWLFAISFLFVTSVLMGCVPTASSTPVQIRTSAPSAVPNSPTSQPTDSPIPAPTNLPASTPTRIPTLTVISVPEFHSTPGPAGTPVSPDSTQVQLIADAKADLVTRANVSADVITVVSVEPTEWKDASLGCPKLGVFYIQVITPGYKIILQAQGKQYEYHTGNSRVVYCEPH